MPHPWRFARMMFLCGRHGLLCGRGDMAAAEALEDKLKRLLLRWDTSAEVAEYMRAELAYRRRVGLP